MTRDEKRPVTTLSAKGCAGARSTGCRKPQGFTTSLATTGPSRALPSLGRMYGIVTLRCAYSEQLRACTPARVRSREGAPLAGGKLMAKSGAAACLMSGCYMGFLDHC